MKLNLGCGKVVIPGFVGVDMNRGERVHVQAKLWELPFKDSCIDEIYAGHVIEHITDSVLVHVPRGFREVLGLEQVMNEIARVLKPGGRILIRVPYAGSGQYDVYHYKQFDEQSFYRWTRGDGRNTNLQEKKAIFSMEWQKVNYLGPPFEWHINKYLPKLNKYVPRLSSLLKRFDDNPYPDDGRLRIPFGFGMTELTVVLSKPGPSPG